MAVMTTSPNKSDIIGQHVKAKKHAKNFDKTRPITATLDHPLILDIKLLKKLDMTTFTKRGLIALSKFCGISLINKKESKRKLNKCLKSIQRTKKQIGAEGEFPTKCFNLELNKKNSFKTKKKVVKQIAKINSRLSFSWSEEDSSDVVCKRHNKISKTGIELKLTKNNNASEKNIINDLFRGTKENVISEPCKTCSRSEYPERFHSHPKVKLPEKRKPSEKTDLEERFKNSVTTVDLQEDSAKEKTNPSAKESAEFLQKSPSLESKINKSTSNKQKTNVESLIKISNCHSSSEAKNSKAVKDTRSESLSSAESKSQSDVIHLKKMNTKNNKNQKNEEHQKSSLSADDALKFVTGCYVCGKPISPKLRMKHEEGCILEWRSQNQALPPEKRNPEPIRPDYRFTASGDLDPEGTFESIWANHKDSLVPCKKCGRKFFPDRIERHENCCNNQPINFKYKNT